MLNYQRVTLNVCDMGAKKTMVKPIHKEFTGTALPSLLSKLAFWMCFHFLHDVPCGETADGVLPRLWNTVFSPVHGGVSQVVKTSWQNLPTTGLTLLTVIRCYKYLGFDGVTHLSTVSTKSSVAETVAGIICCCRPQFTNWFRWNHGCPQNDILFLSLGLYLHGCCLNHNPICSMYGIFTNMYPKNHPVL